MLKASSNRRGRNHRGGKRQTRYNLSPFSKATDPIEEFAYSSSMDPDDTCSNENWGNNASLVKLDRDTMPSVLRTYFGEYGFLNKYERRELSQYAGCIVHESSDGFLTINWYYDLAELLGHWANVQKEYYPADDEDEESEDN